MAGAVSVRFRRGHVGSQSPLFSALIRRILWQIRQLPDNMQRFALLTCGLAAVFFWFLQTGGRPLAQEAQDAAAPADAAESGETPSAETPAAETPAAEPAATAP